MVIDDNDLRKYVKVQALSKIMRQIKGTPYVYFA
jgi:hypothetical protein